MKKYLVFITCFFVLLILLFKFGQSESGFDLYKQVISTVENVDGQRIATNKPFTEVNLYKLTNWDAEHYYRIKEKGYVVDINQKGSNNIYAFFPLFPWIWKLFFLPDTWVVLLNYILFGAALFIVNLALFNRLKLMNVLLIFALPGLVNFIIPYSEATSAFVLSIAFLGYLRDNYKIYFLGAFLAALARSSFSLLLVGFVLIETIKLIQNPKYFKSWLFVCVKRSLPILLGTLTLGIVQWLYGAKNLFQYIEVLKNWGNSFGIPHNLRDWSNEGFGMSLAFLIVLIFPIAIWFADLGVKLIKQLFNIEDCNPVFKTKKDELFWLSGFYLLGVSMTLLFLRAGVIPSLSRYVLSTPFTWIFFLLLPGYLDKFDQFLIKRGFWVLTVLSIFLITVIPYSTYWDFNDFGLILVLGIIGFTIYHKSLPNILQYGLIGVLLLCNAFWTVYLFNNFLNDSWIFS